MGDKTLTTNDDARQRATDVRGATGSPRIPHREGSAHTPGPWTVDDQRQRGDIYTTVVIRPHAQGFMLATLDAASFTYGDGGMDIEANARLIAAAPELLAALKAVVTHLGGGSFHHLTGENAERALAAIAKAEGQ